MTLRRLKWLAVIALGPILAGKIAGYFGLDAYILPALGTPWKPGFAWPYRRSQADEEPPVGA